MRIRQLTLALAFAAAAPAWAQWAPSTPPAPLGLREALSGAVGNRDVALARQALAAAQADIRSADHAPLPVLSAKAASIDLQNGIGGGSLWSRKRIDKAVGLDWTLERGGKRQWRTQVAQRNAEAAGADVQDVQAQQAQAALGAYFDLLAAQERLRELRSIEASAHELDRAAQRRVAAGDLSPQDALRIRIEAERARADAEAAARDQTQARAALVALLPGWAGGTDVAPDWLAADLVDAAIAPERLQQWVQERPDVRAAQARVQAAQSGLELAQSLRRADWTVGVSYDHFPGTSTRLLELRWSMPLALGYRYEGEIGRAQAELAQAEEALQKLRHQAELELRQLQQTALQSARRMERFATEILPRAQQVVQSAEFAYAKGALPLADLLDARRTLRATAVEALQSRQEFSKAAGAWLLRTRPQALLGAAAP